MEEVIRHFRNFVAKKTKTKRLYSVQNCPNDTLSKKVIPMSEKSIHD
jgi:hypothetical protein